LTSQYLGPNIPPDFGLGAVMGVVGRIVAIAVMGCVLFALIAIPIATAFAAASGSAALSAPAAFGPVGVVAALTMFVAVLAPTARIAWGRLFVLAGLAGFALPFQGLIVSAVVGSATITAAGGHPGAAAGAALAGVVLTSAAAFLGLFIGLIFVVAAYFTLRGAPRPLRIRG
jgi:hypothetical protein